MKQNIALLLILAAILTLSCPANNKDTELELRYGFTTEPTTLDPLNPSNTADGRSILFNVFEGLVKPNTDGTFLPCIAESWTIEQGGLVYNFVIRENVQFHDGTIVTVQDVKFSLDTAITAGFVGLNNIDEVVIQSDNQIKIILKTGDPEFLPFLTTAIIKDGNTNRERDINGTGPFYIESYTPQRNLVLKKFDNYWQNGLPHLETITLVFFANFDTLIVALRGGSIDGAFITGSMAEQLNQNDFDIFNNSSAGVQLMALNNNAAPFNDIRVRRAINYGIDIQGIIDAAFFGHGNPSASPIIPGLSVYYESSLDYEYNTNLAQSLLSQAGFNETNRLSFEITVPSNFTMHVDTAQVIVSQLEKINVNANIRLVDWSTWLSEVYSARQYQATIISVDSQSVSPRGFLSRYQSGNSGNFINFSNADFDSVYNAALTQTNQSARIELYKNAQRIIAENAASLYIQDILYFIALKGGAFGGVLDYPLYVIDF
ncbi:MAG: ABC transporter substrate-binding protein, partial [Treponema sp.]|nr:ABC transporter substrate-binding protein [Treponema sp.]